MAYAIGDGGKNLESHNAPSQNQRHISHRRNLSDSFSAAPPHRAGEYFQDGRRVDKKDPRPRNNVPGGEISPQITPKIEGHTRSQATALPTYNGTSNPEDHVDICSWHMRSQKIDPGLWCTYFSATLEGNAKAWLQNLAPGSISNFERLKQLFLEKFGQPNNSQRRINAVLRCKQLEGEPVKEYFERFSRTLLNVPEHDDDITMKAFAYGLLPSKLSRSMIIQTPRSRQELQGRIEEHLRNIEGRAEAEENTKTAAQRKWEKTTKTLTCRTITRDREGVALKKYEGDTDPKAHVETYIRLMRYLGTKKELWSQLCSARPRITSPRRSLSCSKPAKEQRDRPSD